jgi:hypothetical protein
VGAITVSRRLAIVVGTATPVLELVRRRSQLTIPSAFPFWFDDVLLGGFLLYGAWRARRDPRAGLPWLAAAWGFMIGLAYSSFFGQLQQLSSPDPSGVPGVWVVAVKGLGLVLGVAGLAAALVPAAGRPVRPGPRAD